MLHSQLLTHHAAICLKSPPPSLSAALQQTFKVWCISKGMANRTLKPVTIENYTQRIRTLANHNIKSKQWKDFDKTYEKLCTLSNSKNSIKCFCTAILWKLRQEDERDLALEKQYSKRILQLSKEIAKDRELNKLSEKQRSKFLEWDEILAVRDKIRKEYDESKSQELLKKLLIISLYTLQHTRRLTDYAQLKAVKRFDPKKAENRYNYTVYGAQRPYFLFFNHKNVDKSGTQKIPMKQQMKDLLVEYIKATGTEDNTLVLGMSENTLGKAIAGIFKQYTGKEATVNILRYSYVKSATNKLMNVASRRRIAEGCGHSVVEQLMYNKLS